MSSLFAGRQGSLRGSPGQLSGAMQSAACIKAMGPKRTRNVIAPHTPDTAPTVGAKKGSPDFGKRSQGNALSFGIRNVSRP